MDSDKRKDKVLYFPIKRSVDLTKAISVNDLDLRTWKLLEKIDELNELVLLHQKYIVKLAKKVKALELPTKPNENGISSIVTASSPNVPE